MSLRLVIGSKVTGICNINRFQFSRSALEALLSSSSAIRKNNASRGSMGDKTFAVPWRSAAVRSGEHATVTGTGNTAQGDGSFFSAQRRTSPRFTTMPGRGLQCELRCQTLKATGP